MSKSSLFENKALQQAGVGFNLVTTANSFNSLFAAKPLDPSESEQIEKILTDNFQDGSLEKDQIQHDAAQLKQITAEIRAIGKQGTVLMGERVHRARELLKLYKDGAFTRWLEAAFGTRKTGYNVLAYYEFYNALPRDDLKEKFKKLQQRTAYILASRVGDIEAKVAIVSNYHDRSHDELLALIQEKFPTAFNDKRSSKGSLKKLINNLRENIEKIKELKSILHDENRKELMELKLALDSIF